MSLTVLDNEDFLPFDTAFALQEFGAGSGIDWNLDANQNHDYGYHQPTGLLYGLQVVRGALPTDVYMFTMDPRFRDATVSDSEVTSGSLIPNGVMMGQYNPETNTQRVFAWQNMTNSSFNWVDEFNAVTLARIQQNAFDKVGMHDSSIRSVGNVAAGAVGGWGEPTGATDFEHRILFFDGLTDGIPGETASTGANVYPKGLGLVCAPRWASYLGAQDSNRGMIWIDLDTGLTVGRLLRDDGTIFPGANDNSGDPGAEAPIIGREILWNHAQFVVDPDSSSFVNPKGYLVLTGAWDPSTWDFGSPLQGECWIRFVDFNPHGIEGPGIIPRTHGQITLTTRSVFPFDPVFPGGSTGAANNTERHPIFSPLDNAFSLITVGSGAGSFLVTDRMAFNRWSLSVQPAIVTRPVPASSLQTADAVEMTCKVTGDLSEEVAGAQVTFTVERVSTEGELLDTASLPATNTVENPPIDAGTLVVYENGSPLSTPADYTVDESTGVITWAGSHPNGGSVYTVDYEHFQTGATPAHGTLLGTTAITDANGNASVQVSYPNDTSLVGEFDRFTADV